MRRVTARAAVAALVAGLLSPLPLAATAAPAHADTYGSETTVAGGGRGLSGPASRALFGVNDNTRVDAAPDGSVLVNDDSQVLRVQPDSDTVAIMPGTTVTSADQPISDVAAAGSAVVFTTASGVERAASDGTTTQLLARSDAHAVDVGADGVVWVATSHDVLRILPDGTVHAVTTATSNFGYALDLAVTPDGSTAYVLDDGVGRYGVYQVTSAGIGARVAGDLMRDDSLQAGIPAASASTEAVRSLTTDGTTITLASPEYRRVVRFAVGGVLTQVLSGYCSQSIAMRGPELVTVCRNASSYSPTSLHRFSSAGADLGRILGTDPAAPWSPDGVRATDAYLDTVRGAAGLPDGRIVFSTEHGLVREVGADGLLHTRATLAPIASRGKVAVGSDGTAYVVTDAGGVVKVPATGPPVPLSVDADATDVEVAAGGAVIVADGRGHRLLRVPADGGSATVLTDALATPSDIGLDGDTVLVADTGLRRVAANGGVSILLSGGSPPVAAASPAGVWTTGLSDSSWLYVLLPGGGLAPVRADQGPRAQVQAVGDGSVLVAGGTSVRLVNDPGLPAAVPDLAVTATPGGGRILLGWDGRIGMTTTVIAKPGDVPPADYWDGVPVASSSVGDPYTADSQHVVLRIGDHVLQAGEQWSFAVFAMVPAPLSDNRSIETWSAGATATATVLPDTTPPPVVTPTVNVTQTVIGLSWDNRVGDDFDHSVLRMTPGTTPPATPDDGTELVPDIAGSFPSAHVPDPVPGQDYALSLFAVDLHGNYSQWSGVLRLDVTPPATVTDLQVTPAYKYATFSFTRPSDPDYARVAYAVAAGNETPSRQNAAGVVGSPVTAWGLTMGTGYTLAVWSIDTNGNVSEPAVTHFTTLLDTQPPGSVTALSATGGDYQISATWIPPTDSDLDKLTARLTDTSTGTVTSANLAKTATGYAWPRLPGGRSYTVSVVATDVNGLTSDVSTATAQTNPDTNGAPPPVDPTTVTVTPHSSTSVYVLFPKPTIPDLRTIGYATVPLGQDPGAFTTVHPLATYDGVDNVNGLVTLPQPVTAFQLILLVWDFNGNRAQSVVPQVEGVPSASELPVAPERLSVTSPADRTLAVSWTSFDGLGTRATSWTVTASSGSLTRTVTVPGVPTPVLGLTFHANLADLAGGREWTVTVTGINALGIGPTVTAAPVAVSGVGPPPPVTRATRTPGYDSEVLTWRNPGTADFDHVEVTRRGATPAETLLVYRGRATVAHATGLVPARTYTFEIRTFDRLGETVGAPVTVTTRQSSLTLDGAATAGSGAELSLTGGLTWNGTPVAGRRVTVQSLPAGASIWRTVAAVTTTPSGSFTASVHPMVTTRYRAAYLGSAATGGCYSPVSTVTVAPPAAGRAVRTVPARRWVWHAW